MEKIYVTPEVEVIEVNVESGFALSAGSVSDFSSTDYDVNS